MRTSFQGIPDSLDESAKLDGAGHMTILFRIILPLSKAVVAVIILFIAVGQWNSWFMAMIFLQTRSLFPLQLILREILVQNDTSKIMVGSDAVAQMDLYKPLVQYCTTIVATAPILCIYPFVQKYFVTGVMIGSLKG
jgi:putative aldouronate transport system permease protein